MICSAATQPRPLHYDGLALLTTIGKLDLTRAAELAAVAGHAAVATTLVNDFLLGARRLELLEQRFARGARLAGTIL